MKAAGRTQQTEGEQEKVHSAPRSDQSGSDPRSATAFVALGSNLGDSAAILRAAMDRLQALSATPLLRSSLWRSSPVGCPPGSPPFVNGVVGLTPLAKETPESFLQKLQAMEREFGRGPREVLNEPRLLDLDLVSWGAEIHETPSLTLPHPRAQFRKFVLQPLSEIAPEFVLPGQRRTVKQLLRRLKTPEVLQRMTV